MTSDLTPRERALMALYGPRPPDIKGGAVTEAIESAIVAAVAEERERCADVARKFAWPGGMDGMQLHLRDQIARAIAAERDRCAKIADNYATGDRRDAARYRWLRDHQDCIPNLISTCSRELAAKTLDAFLDAEISAEPE
jgi:hypothetical protein